MYVPIVPPPQGRCRASSRGPPRGKEGLPRGLPPPAPGVSTAPSPVCGRRPGSCCPPRGIAIHSRPSSPLPSPSPAPSLSGRVVASASSPGLASETAAVWPRPSTGGALRARGQEGGREADSRLPVNHLRASRHSQTRVGAGSLAFHHRAEAGKQQPIASKREALPLSGAIFSAGSSLRRHLCFPPPLSIADRVLAPPPLPSAPSLFRARSQSERCHLGTEGGG